MVLSNLHSELVINDLEAAAFLVEPANSEHLSPFMTGEKSLSEAASELGLSKSLMGYWVKKLLRLNLITVLRVEKRGKHNVPIYGARAEAYIVPLDVLTADPNKDVFASANFERDLKRSLVHHKHQSLRGRHVRYAREAENVVLEVLPRKEEASALADHWGQVGLTKAQASEFYREVNALFNRIVEEAKDDGGQKYLFKLVLVEQWPQ